MQKVLLQTKRLELLVADHDDLLGLVRAVEIAVDIERGPNAQFLLQLAEEGQDQRIERFFGGALHEVGSIESKLRQRIAEEAAAKASKVNSKVINDPHFAWPDLAHIDNCFAIFGLTQSATATDVSREYKSQAKRFQTDCGGNLQEMQRINAARERIYDYLDAIGASTNFPLHSK